MSARSRQAVAYGVCLVSGAALFFLCFAAIFNGSWPLLLFFLLGYVAAGALGVWAGGAAPAHLALVLVAPAVPWVLWLFPASVPEAGLLRALLWPALVAVMGGAGWLGGKAVAVARARAGRSRVADDR